MHDRTRRIARATAMFAAAFAVGFGGWLAGRSSALGHSPTETGAPPTRTDTVESPPTPSTQLRPDRSRALPDRPLPPVDAPLREVLSDLRKRADGGEAAAACRLAAEMEYCNDIRARLESNSRLLRHSQASYDALQDARGARMTAALRAAQRSMIARSEQLLEESEHCSDVPQFDADERVRYWRSAAHSGNVVAQRHYAVGNAFRLDDSLDNLDELRVYRGEAEAMAWRAVRAGDVPTTLALAQAYSPSPPTPRRYLLAQSVRPDAVQALALLLLAQSRIRSGAAMPAQRSAPIALAIQELEEALPPEQRARARRDAADYNRSIPASEPDSSSVNRSFYGTPLVQRHECSDVPAASSTETVPPSERSGS